MYNDFEIVQATAENILAMFPKLPDIDERIEDIALKYCKDYPEIKTTDSYERLWAIECAIGGCRDAVGDWHKLVQVLQKRYNIAQKELNEISLTLLNERYK